MSQELLDFWSPENLKKYEWDGSGPIGSFCFCGEIDWDKYKWAIMAEFEGVTEEGSD